jgi:hypothetical protein
MAVRDMVSNLADGPALRTIGRVELLLRKPCDGSAQAAGRLLDVLEELVSLFRSGWAFVCELADGIAQVGH